MTKLLNYLFPKKKVVTLEEQTAKMLKDDYREAVKAYHAAIVRYNMAVNEDNEEVLYKAMVTARDNVDNMVRLIKLNAHT